MITKRNILYLIGFGILLATLKQQGAIKRYLMIKEEERENQLP